MKEKMIYEMTVEEFFNEFKKLNDKNTQNKKEYISREEVCRILHISLPTLNNLFNTNKLTRYKFGGRKVLIKMAEVESLLAKDE